MSDDVIVDLYERHARDFDRERGRTLQEKAWLDRFLSHVPQDGVILDIGCGTAQPIARYLIEAGRRVVGVDSSPSMIDICRGRFPDQEWLVADMRQLELHRRFDGILAWDSFFHLNQASQRAMFPRFAAHAKPNAALMFTSGPRDGEAIGSFHGEPLFHSSLAPSEYERLLDEHGFQVRAFVPDDPECGGHTIWLASCDQYR